MWLEPGGCSFSLLPLPKLLICFKGVGEPLGFAGAGHPWGTNCTLLMCPGFCLASSQSWDCPGALGVSRVLPENQRTCLEGWGEQGRWRETFRVHLHSFPRHLEPFYLSPPSPCSLPTFPRRFPPLPAQPGCCPWRRGSFSGSSQRVPAPCLGFCAAYGNEGINKPSPWPGNCRFVALSWSPRTQHRHPSSAQ